MFTFEKLYYFVNHHLVLIKHTWLRYERKMLKCKISLCLFLMFPQLVANQVERIRQEETCPHKVMNHVKELAELLFKNVRSQMQFLKEHLSCFLFLSHHFLSSSLLFSPLPSLQENPYPSVSMHKVQRPSESSQNSAQSRSAFPVLDEVAVQLFIDHAAAKLKTAPPVVKAEVKDMVPSGPPLGEQRLLITC